MVDAGLIASATIVPFFLIAFNLITMAKYIDPEAAGGHYLAKLLILIGMLMAECTVLLLPLDVGNQAGALSVNTIGGLNLSTTWLVAYCIIVGLVIVVMPFFIFYYEADDEGMDAKENGEDCWSWVRLSCTACKRSCCTAIINTCIISIIAVILFFVLYSYIAYTQIPYAAVSVSVSSVAFGPVGTPYSNSATCVSGFLCTCGRAGGCTRSSNSLRMDVTAVVFMAALLTFIGWFVFSIWAGIGLVALPMDLIYAYRNRPKMLTVSEVRNTRKTIMKKSEELIKIGDEMATRLIDALEAARGGGQKRKAQREHKADLARFRLLVDQIENDLDDLQLGDPANYKQHYNPLVPYFKLLAGVFSIIVSLLWFIQIVIFMLPSPAVHPFLNTYLVLLDAFFPLLGTLTIGGMAIYLLLCASVGAAKFGTRFFLIDVHPLEPGKTLLNSFMFNVQLVLLCVLPTVQFSTQAFSQYARYTEADVLFGTQMRYIQGFRFFWQYNVFIFILIIFAGLSLIYFSIWPSDRAHLNDVMKKIREQKGKERSDFSRKLTQQGGALSLV